MNRNKTGLVFALFSFLICFGKAQAGVVAEYRFDETGGTVAHASVGSVNGNLGGSASFVGGGVRGGALSLNKATNDYVEMGDNFYFASSFSVEAWVRMPAGTADLGAAVSKHHATQVSGYFLAIGNIGDGCSGGPGSTHFYVAYPCSGNSTKEVNDGEWHQVVGTYDGSRTSIFVDGVFQSSSPGGNSSRNNDAPFMVGGLKSWDGTLVGGFTGQIDEVRVYDSALSVSEVGNIYASVTAVPEPETYAMMLAGLGLLGIARRRRFARMPAGVR
jgi:hypothetical protein